MPPNIPGNLRRNWRSLFGLALMMAVGPMCGGGGGGGGSTGGGTPAPTFKVVSTFPNQSDTGVARTQTIFLTVNGNVKLSTLTTTNITLTGATNIPIALNWNANLGQIEIRPQGPNFMDWNGAHTVNVFAGLQTTTGTAIAPKTFSFTTTNAAAAATDVAVPSFPTGVSGATLPASDPHSLTLNWTTPGSDPGGTAVGSLIYDVYYATSMLLMNFARLPDKSSGAGASNVLVDLLPSNTDLVYVVRCRDLAGNRDENVINVPKKTLVSFLGDVYNGIVNNSSTGHCTNCHAPAPAMASFMDLLTGGKNGALAAWIDVAASANGLGPGPNFSTCGGAGNIRVIKTPAPDAANSLVYRKVAGTPSCGLQMPEDGPPYLSGTQAQTIFDWINQGANDN